jgi:hypothetical protein
MSEIIFEIIVRSITPKAKQQQEEKALLSCTESKIEEETKTKQEFLYIRILMDYGRV